MANGVRAAAARVNLRWYGLRGTSEPLLAGLFWKASGKEMRIRVTKENYRLKIAGNPTDDCYDRGLDRVDLG